MCAKDVLLLLKSIVDEDISFKESLYNSIHHYWSENSESILFAAPFLLTSLVAPFNSMQPIGSRLGDGLIRSTVAFTISYYVQQGLLYDYSLSYLPTIWSGVYYWAPDTHPKEYKVAVTSISTLAIKVIIDNGYWYECIAPAINYGFCKINHAPNIHCEALTTVAGILDHWASQDGVHHVTYSMAGYVVMNRIMHSAKIHEYINVERYVDTDAINIMGIIAGSLLAEKGSEIFGNLLAMPHFHKSYNALLQIYSKQELDPILERYTIMTSVLNIGMGIYGNNLLIEQQTKNIALSAIKGSSLDERISKFSTFYALALNYIVYVAPMYIAATVAVDMLNEYEIVHLNAELKRVFIERYMFDNATFLKAANAQFAHFEYMKAIEKTVTIDSKAIAEIVRSLPKLVKLVDLNMNALLKVSSFAAMDLTVSQFFQHIAGAGQYYEDQLMQCQSDLARITSVDRMSAAIIMQKDGIAYTACAWQALEYCIYKNKLGKAITDNIVHLGQMLYSTDILFTAIQLVTAELLCSGIIEPTSVYLHHRILHAVTDCLLFQVHHDADFQQVEAATDIVMGLVHYLNTSSLYSNTDIRTDPNAQCLGVSIEFSRGQNEKLVHLNISDIQLCSGKKYAITGANGSGKSSFVILLKYLLNDVYDESFNVKRGHILSPSEQISFIPQKDYIVRGVHLFDLIMYPLKASEIQEAEHKLYEGGVLEWINKLHIFGDGDFRDTELYNINLDLNELSGGQKKKLFLIKHFVTCPKILIMDETFGPLDSSARALVMQSIENSCLNDSIIAVVWHQDKNQDGSSCVVEQFFDYELHIANHAMMQMSIGSDCD